MCAKRLNSCSPLLWLCPETRLEPKKKVQVGHLAVGFLLSQSPPGSLKFLARPGKTASVCASTNKHACVQLHLWSGCACVLRSLRVRHALATASFSLQKFAM